MMARCTLLASVSLAAILFCPLRAEGQADENRTVELAGQVLQEIMAVPAKAIPESLLANAEGLVIVPNVIRAGFVVGGRFGKGVVVIRDQSGSWTSPTFISLTGGSLGWQAGVQATDVILVFRTRKSVAGLLDGQFTIGADAAVAAGPVGRQATAATNASFQAEILSYSRSRGLFAGVALDGTMIQIDRVATSAYYNSYTALGPQIPVSSAPASAGRLVNLIAQYTGNSIAPPGTGGAPAVPPDQDLARRQLLAESTALQRILDPEWQKYFALPVEIYQGAQPAPVALQSARERYDQVANDPRYQALAQRPEFQNARRALLQYCDRQSAANGPINLPPPPTVEVRPGPPR